MPETTETLPETRAIDARASAAREYNLVLNDHLLQSLQQNLGNMLVRIERAPSLPWLSHKFLVLKCLL